MNAFRFSVFTSSKMPYFLLVATFSVLLPKSTVGFSSHSRCSLSAILYSNPQKWERTTSSISSLYDVTASNSHEFKFNEKNENNTASSCPYSMTFPRYRIPLSRGEQNLNSNNNIFTGLFSGMISLAQKSAFEQKYSSSKMNIYDESLALWYDPKSEIPPNDAQNDNEKLQSGKIGVYTSAFVWRALANLLQEFIRGKYEKYENVKKAVIIGLPNFSVFGLKQFSEIINWMSEEEQYYLPTSAESKIKIEASVDEDSPVPTILLLATKVGRRDSLEHLNSGGHNEGKKLNKSIVRDRTKAWVDRVLVKMKICPFTKSTSKSGQGLGDVGVPVGAIAYHYSPALQSEFPMLMADTWEAISNMIKAGPSGKNGVSSILLAAPDFDNHFSLWAGPLFAMLEASVCAARAEPIIGIVCFHPEYKTPDGNSWPGFGHMHSLPRLGKWIKENDEDFFNNVEDRDISAGGAFQRRTPHATINVLRAEQLEAAEGRRSSASLYSINIRRLYEEGFGKLEQDLKKEQNLMNF